MHIPSIVCGSKTIMTCTVLSLLNMRSFLFKCMNVPSPHSKVVTESCPILNKMLLN